MIARQCLLFVLLPMLVSCASLRQPQVVFVPPRIDCAAYDPPQAQAPSEPALTAKDVAVWQLYAWKWQAYAEHVLGQRVETAVCLKRLTQQGVIK